MPSPPQPVRPAGPHAAVKHELLVRYLDVWTPTVLHGARRVTYAEAYAGSDLGADDGAAVMALRVFGEFTDRMAGRHLAMVLLEPDARLRRMLADRLAAVHAELGAPPELSVHTVGGASALDLVPALREAGASGGPVLAYLDTFGEPGPPFEVVAAVGGSRANEVIVALDPALLAGLATGQTPAETGDAIFGGSTWRSVSDQPAEGRYPYLVTCYRRALHARGFRSVAHVELVDNAGHAQLLVFGTASAKHLERLKDELWAVDEYAGVRYRDPLDPDHTLLDISLQPGLGPLRRALVREVATRGERTVAELRQHTVAETLYRAQDATRALNALLAAGTLTRVPERGRLAPDTVIGPGRGPVRP